MDYSLVILSVCMYTESRVKGKLDPRDMEQAIGYSYSHIRKAFKEGMQIPVSRYILLRKLSYAAFDIIHTEKNLLDIAMEYGFEQYDGFTRAFRRETGLIPSEFRKRRERAGRRLIAPGVYAPAIFEYPTSSYEKTEAMMNQKSKKECILLGVPKVEYKWEECTPFPSCLHACLNYMGQDISYAYLMAASGAAFRLRWNKNEWDGGNVDICLIYEDVQEAFSRSFAAAGRSCRFLKREDSDKQGFINFIKSEIKEGRPVIALGIVGPPEACIVTGYQDDGNSLLGWNFFQHRPEYNRGTSFHESGYFISDTWWENEGTVMLMSIGETQSSIVSDKEILLNAVNVTDHKPIIQKCGCEIACGQEAYKAWASQIEDDRQFGDNITLVLLNVRFMCQIDAQSMVGEGRWHAAEYLKAVAKRHAEVSEMCYEAASCFCKASEAASRKMYAVLGEHESEEAGIRHFAKADTRKQIVELIKEAAENEYRAITLVEEITQKISAL